MLFFQLWLELLNRKNTVYKNTEAIDLLVDWDANEEMDIKFGISVKCADGTAAGLAESTDVVKTKKDEHCSTISSFDTSNLVPGYYTLSVQPYYLTETRNSYTVDETLPMQVEIIDGKGSEYRIWARQYWGSIRLNDVKIVE